MPASGAISWQIPGARNSSVYCAVLHCTVPALFLYSTMQRQGIRQVQPWAQRGHLRLRKRQHEHQLRGGGGVQRTVTHTCVPNLSTFKLASRLADGIGACSVRPPSTVPEGKGDSQAEHRPHRCQDRKAGDGREITGFVHERGM